MRIHQSKIANPKCLEPPAHDDFLLGIEGNGIAAVGVKVAKEGVLPAAEWEERHQARQLGAAAELMAIWAVDRAAMGLVYSGQR